MKTRMCVIALLMLVTLVAVTPAAADDPPTWWQNRVKNGDFIPDNYGQGSGWSASDNQNASQMVQTRYMIPPDKTQTIQAVTNAVMAFNEALAKAGKLGTTTAIPSDGSFQKDKVYYTPSPEAITKILEGQNPADVVNQELQNPLNQKHLDGTAGSDPLYIMGFKGKNDADNGGSKSGGGTTPPPSTSTPGTDVKLLDNDTDDFQVDQLLVGNGGPDKSFTYGSLLDVIHDHFPNYTPPTTDASTSGSK